MLLVQQRLLNCHQSSRHSRPPKPTSSLSLPDLRARSSHPAIPPASQVFHASLSHLHSPMPPLQGYVLIPTSYPTQVGNYCKIYQSLAEAILADDQSKFVVSPEEAILNIRLIEAGLQSSKERRTIDIE